MFNNVQIIIEKTDFIIKYMYTNAEEWTISEL